MGQEVSNSDLFLWSLYELGGATQYIDVERVFYRCWEHGPKRFSWRTRSDLPDYKKCSKALRDAEARVPRLLIKTQDSYGRQLTAEGKDWVEQNRTRMTQLLGGEESIPEPRSRPNARMLTRIERSPLFERWLGEGLGAPERWELAELLRCSPDSRDDVWQRRIESARSAAVNAGRQDVLAFLDDIRSYSLGPTEESK